MNWQKKKKKKKIRNSKGSNSLTSKHGMKFEPTY